VGERGRVYTKHRLMLFFCRDDGLARLPFRGRIRLELLWEDRVMPDRGDGEGTVLVQASKGAALAPCSEDRPSFDSPIQNMIPSSWEVQASCTRHARENRIQK
jgi:hypothetical protein